MMGVQLMYIRNKAAATQTKIYTSTQHYRPDVLAPLASHLCAFILVHVCRCSVPFPSSHSLLAAAAAC